MADETPTPTDRIPLSQIRRVMALVLRPPLPWVLVIAVAVVLSTVHVERKTGGDWTVDFSVGSITAALVGLVWLPAVIRLVALTGGAFKTPAGEASTPGLLDVVRSLQVDRTTLPEYSPPWAADAATGAAAAMPDVTQPTPVAAFSSLGPELIRLIQDPAAADYAVIDLGSGNQWLTSRLFLFADLLARMRGLRCFVFVRTDAAVERRFVGTVSPVDLRWALATQYPWLESAFASAYAELPRHDIRSTKGALDVDAAGTLVFGFLQKLQRPNPAGAGEEGEWVQVDAAGGWEHAEWLGADLPASVRTILSQASVPDGPEAEIARAVLARFGARFVAVVGPVEEFRRLVDRSSLLEQTAARVSQASIVMKPADRD